MEIRIQKNPAKLSILSRTTFILVGVMLTSLVFSVGIKHLNIYGIYLGLLLSIPGIYFGFKKTTSNSKTRMLVWGLSIMTAMLVISYIVFIVKISTIEI